jgi:hypothetical protein
MTVSIACIVEGHGEVASLPILIRRIAQAQNPSIEVLIPPPIRRSRGSLLKDGALENDIGLAASKISGRGGILVLIDSDDDCPAVEARKLTVRLPNTRSDLPSAIVLAKREFEGWFLAGAESLRGKRRLPENLAAPPNPEAIRGAKEWLKQRTPQGQRVQPDARPAGPFCPARPRHGCRSLTLLSQAAEGSHPALLGSAESRDVTPG